MEGGVTGHRQIHLEEPRRMGSPRMLTEQELMHSLGYRETVTLLLQVNGEFIHWFDCILIEWAESNTFGCGCSRALFPNLKILHEEYPRSPGFESWYILYAFNCSTRGARRAILTSIITIIIQSHHNSLNHHTHLLTLHPKPVRLPPF